MTSKFKHNLASVASAFQNLTTQLNPVTVLIILTSVAQDRERLFPISGTLLPCMRIPPQTRAVREPSFQHSLLL